MCNLKVLQDFNFVATQALDICVHYSSYTTLIPSSNALNFIDSSCVLEISSYLGQFNNYVTPWVGGGGGGVDGSTHFWDSPGW